MSADLRDLIADAINGRPLAGDMHPDDRECIYRAADDVLDALGLEQVGWGRLTEFGWHLQEDQLNGMVPVYRLRAQERSQ